MKNTLKIALLSAGMLSFSVGYAQEHKSVTKEVGGAAKDVGHATATGAKAVGTKTSQLASKGAAAVTDKRYDGHWALTGELVYIDEHGKYFYVDKKGHRQFITKAQMRTKPLKD